MKKWILFCLLSIMPMLSASDKRDYFTKLSSQEAKDIQYIVTTLGNTSSVGLLFKKKSLEQAGDRIQDVHPLRFFGYVLSQPRLKASLANIKGMAWTNFEEGMIGSLQKADSRNNLNNKIIDDFSRQSHLDPAKVQAYVKNKQWKGLIEFVRKQA